MAKPLRKSKAPVLPKKLVGKGVAFVGKFGYGTRQIDEMKALVKTEGRVVDGEKVAPDYLVEGDGVAGKPPAATAKIQKKFPTAQVLDQTGFYRHVAPTPDDLMAVLAAGPHPYEFWSTFREQLRLANMPFDLSGRDFRKFDLTGTNMQFVTVDDADFRGAKLHGAQFGQVRGARFDSADMVDGYLTNAEGCSFRNANLDDARFNPAEFKDCDFSGAVLTKVLGSYTRATDCNFSRVKAASIDLDESDLKGCDFSRADLTAARLAKTDFTNADLSGADLSKADARSVKFVNADLRKAKFKGTVLTGADFTGAKIDGADFTGANLTGVIAPGLDPKKAKGFQLRAARTAGPSMNELAKVAAGSKKFQTSIELDLGPNESVVLSPSWHTYGSRGYAGAGYSHEAEDGGLGSSVDAPTFQQGMLNLVDLWDRGKPKFDTIKVETKKCPLKGKALQSLVVAAWYEVFGLTVPTEAEMEKASAVAETTKAGLRDVMLAELTGGPAGVKKWNARPDKERTVMGSMKGMDFSDGKLAGANFTSQDVRKARFDRANLKKAHFYPADVTDAVFDGAVLPEACFMGKTTGASFVGAKLAGAVFYRATLRRCAFVRCDLMKATFAYSDLGGADLSSATLDGAEFTRSRFDEKTKLPPGYVPPDGLAWKGAGPRPGSAPVVVKPGTIDFDAFYQLLTNKVEAGRIAKAKAMLKAERFQLYADVKPDSVTGVVKSQTSKDLVYSCRLASDGAFACCTQNLKACGGLNGALCKHLLVLIVGLAKAGQFDPATADAWTDASKAHKPKFDPDVMSEAFLKFKGAEAGEIDWRPTETIPEDFYAM